MATNLKNLSSYDPKEIPDGRTYTIGIIVSEYNSDITFALRDAAINTLLAHNVSEDSIIVDYAPGAYELPLAAQTLYLGEECDAVIVLGCVIKGDTDHDIYINNAVSQALMNLSLDANAPFIFGLLTTNDHQQAVDRAGGKHGNKGIECAIAALKMVALRERHIQDEDIDDLFEDEDFDEELN
ncbi:MAG: 6,7-dimethyl-8-ribityllumazine synthase [Bacteroidetes bacterium]|nr:6,7-dimethyl-8-ribityllumazine synthase [Bacteroidota bacterium]